MAQRRSLFARERGLIPSSVLPESPDPTLFEIREKTPEELQAFRLSAPPAPELGFPEVQNLPNPLLPSPAPTLLSEGIPESIKEENNERLRTMSPDAIRAARAEIYASLSPEHIKMLQARGISKPDSKSSPSSSTPDFTSSLRNTCMSQAYVPDHPEDKVKYGIEGTVVQEYVQGAWTNSDCQGYTITEVLLLARSIVPTQRVWAMQMIRKIVQGRFTVVVNHMIKNCGLLLVLRVALDDSSISVFSAGLETLSEIVAYQIDDDLTIERFSSLLYPRTQSVSQNALLSPASKSKPELLEEQEIKYDNEPEQVSEESEDDLDLSCTDFIGALIRTGVLQRLNYLLRVHASEVRKESAASVVLACGLHSVSACFAIVRTEGLIERCCEHLWDTDGKIALLLSLLSSASHSLAVKVLTLRSLWIGQVTQGLLDLETPSALTLASWELLDGLMRYKMEPVALEALINPITRFLRNSLQSLTETQGKVLSRIFSLLSRRISVKSGEIHAFTELGKVFLRFCAEKEVLSVAEKQALIGVSRYFTSSLLTNPGFEPEFWKAVSKSIQRIALERIDLKPFEDYYTLETEYSSSLPRLNLYMNNVLWEEQDRFKVEFKAAIVNLYSQMRQSECEIEDVSQFEAILGQIYAFLRDCVDKTAKTKVPNILAYRLQDFVHLTVGIVDYIAHKSTFSQSALRCSHLTFLYLSPYLESYLHQLLETQLFRGLPVTEDEKTAVSKYYLGFLSSSEHLSRSDHFLLQEAKLSSYTLCLAENRFLPVPLDHLYLPLRTEVPTPFLKVLSALEDWNCIAYCPVHMKLAILNDFCAGPNFDENDENAICLLTKLANDPGFALRLDEIKESIFRFLRFYTAASFCSPVLTRWLMVYLRPEVGEDIRRFVLQETEMLFGQMCAACGNQVIGDPERYLTKETSIHVLEFYRFVQLRVAPGSFFAEVIRSALVFYPETD